MGETRQLAEFALNLRLEDCPKEVIQQAKRCTIETMGCALGGAKTPLSQVAAKAVGRLGRGVLPPLSALAASTNLERFYGSRLIVRPRSAVVLSIPKALTAMPPTTI